MTIPMRPDHIRLIQEGRKTATLRSLKETYPMGLNRLPDWTQVFITERTLVLIDAEGVENLDHPSQVIDARALAVKEGYSQWPQVVRVLKRMRHRLPKQMWLYEFNVLE